MKGNEQSVFNTKEYPFLESGIVLELVRTYPTWEMRIPVIHQCRLETFNSCHLKCLAQRKKWGYHIPCTNYGNICTHNMESMLKMSFVQNMLIYFEKTDAHPRTHINQ